MLGIAWPPQGQDFLSLFALHRAAPFLVTWLRLSSGALIVAIMEANNLRDLASDHADFDRVPGLIR